MDGGYKNLDVWHAGMSLAKEVYGITAGFPADERFGLVQQMRRAAVSIPSNLAEGRTRGSDAEFRRFVAIAMGSLAELETQLTLSQELEITKLAQDLLSNCQVLGKRLRKLHQYLTKD
jgi:four helix bundle protein